jgi:hypothetical protein
MHESLKTKSSLGCAVRKTLLKYTESTMETTGRKQEMEWRFGGQVHAGESTKVWVKRMDGTKGWYRTVYPKRRKVTW